MSGGEKKENQKRNCLFLVEADGLFEGRRRVRLALQSSSTQGSPLLELKKTLVDSLELTPAIDAAALEIELYNTKTQSFRRLAQTDKIPLSSCRIRITAAVSKSNSESTTGFGDPSGELLALTWREFSSSIDLDGKLVVKGGKHSIAIGEVSNSGLGTGTNIWDGAIALAKFLEFHDREDDVDDNANSANNADRANKPDDAKKSATISSNKDSDTNLNKDPDISYSVRGKKILELGAGTGLVGIAAHVAFGAREVVLTDLEYSLDNLRNNIAANSCQDNMGNKSDAADATFTRTIDARMLDWFDLETCDAVLERPAAPETTAPTTWYPDIVLAADVVWVESLVRPLVQTLHHICTRSLSQQQQEKQPPLILLSYQRRSQVVEDLLFRTLDEHSFRTEDVTSPTLPTTTGAESKIRIYEITYSPPTG